MSLEPDLSGTSRLCNQRLVGYRLLAGAVAAWLWWQGGRIIASGEHVGVTKRGTAVHMEGAEAYAVAAIYIVFGALLIWVVERKARNRTSRGGA